MSAQADLLELLAREKTAVNFKAPGTSARAAKVASKYAGKTFMLIRTALRDCPMIPDEVARVIGKNLLTVRPRMSDLASPRDERGRRMAPFIVQTGLQRLTDAGSDAAVMRLATDAERANWKPGNPTDGGGA